MEQPDASHDETGHRTTQPLRAVHNGDEGLDVVLPFVYDELRHLAQVIRHRHEGITLSATALVHEAYVKLASTPNLSVRSRAHFFRVAGQAMREVLVEAAERRSAVDRGGDFVPVTLHEDLQGPVGLEPERIIDLHRALGELKEAHPRPAQVVHCRLFSGLSMEETAETLEISVPTVGRDWRFARAWLVDRLGGP